MDASTDTQQAHSTPEPVPALILLTLRRAANTAKRNRKKLDPQTVLDIIDGRKT